MQPALADTALRMHAPLSQTSSVTPEQQKLKATIERRLTPNQLARLQPVRLRLAALGNGSASGDPAAIARMGVTNAFPGASGGDISEMCFVVLMQATEDQDRDLAEIMAETKAQTAAKQGLRVGVSTQEPQATLAANRMYSQNEMSETTSMRLQMAMDRRSKFVEALGNIMKKMSATQGTIIQNMK